ncbi:MAG: penicillin-binding protein activator [Pseudomonadota bacterium]
MMFALNIPRIVAARVAALAAALFLAGCDPTLLSGVGGDGPAIDPSAPVPVALLVPGGGGGDALVSQSLENAARLAIADLEGVQIDLRVYSTGGSQSGANTATNTAISDGAKIILGPLYAAAANGAGLAAASSGTNVLAFSNNPDIAQSSPNVFILGTTFDNVASRLTSYAASRGNGDIIVVNARTTAEEIGRDAIVNAASSNRSNVVGNVSFDLSEAGIRRAANEVAAQVPATNASALFFTSDNAGAMAFLPQYLREEGVSSSTSQFIGLARLDLPAAALQQPGLQGAWLALPDPNLNANFRSRYAQSFGSGPHPLAGLAYDGIAAIGALVASGRSNALSRSALTTGSGFVGVNGIFRLRSDGTNERGLAVAQIQNNQVVVIDPAPRRFGGAGF